MSDPHGQRWRVGRSLGTTIYDTTDDDQPVGWFPDRPDLAQRVVGLLNGASDERGVTIKKEDGRIEVVRSAADQPTGGTE